LAILKQKHDALLQEAGQTGERPLVQNRMGLPVIVQAGEQVFPAPKETEQFVDSQLSRLVDAAKKNPTAPVGIQAMVGMAKTPEQAINFLQTRYPDRVFRSKSGELGYINEDGKPTLIKTKGSLTDLGHPSKLLADALGATNDAVRVLPGLFTGVAFRKAGPGAMVALQAGADAVGELAAQGLGAALPGNDPTTLAERGVGLAQNVGTGLAASLPFGIASALNPVGRVKQQVSAQLLAGKTPQEMAPAIAEGRRLEQKIGYPLSAAELAGTASGKTLERGLSADAGAQMILDAQGAARVNAARDFTDRTIAASTGGVVADAEASLRSGVAAVRAETYKMRAERAATSARQTAEIDAATGNQPIMPTPNTLAVLKKYADQFRPTGIPGERTAAVPAMIQKRLEYFAENPRLRFQDFNNQLADFVDGARGKGGATTGTESGNLTKKIFGDLANAMRADLDELADRGGAGGIGDLVKTYRDTYKVNSAAIEARTSNLISKVVKAKDPGTIMRKVAEASPTELTRVFGYLEAAAPDMAKNVRAGETARMLAPVMQGGDFNEAALAGMLKTPVVRDRFIAVVGNGSGAFLEDMKDAANYAARANARGPNTRAAQRGLVTDAMRILQSSPAGLGEFAGTTMDVALGWVSKLKNPEAVAALIQTQKGRKVLLDLSRGVAEASAIEVSRSALQLGTLLAEEEMLSGDLTPNLPRKGE
jgi:hypothetical protein